MSVTAYVYLQDPPSSRLKRIEKINSDPESQLEVVPVDEDFGLISGDVLYQGDDYRLFIYESLYDLPNAKARAELLRAVPVWKGLPLVIMDLFEEKLGGLTYYSDL